MKRLLPLLVAFVLALPASGTQTTSDLLDANEIATVLKRSADWQLANPQGQTPLTDWVAAPHYDGLLRLAGVTGDAKYLAAVIRFGRQTGWKTHYRTYHADDLAVAHAWLDVYRMDPSHGERLTPTKQHVDAILAAPRTEELSLRDERRFPGIQATDRWTWCDALYMAPPTLVRLYAATGDRRYLDFMDSEFRFTYDRLWDKEEKFFFRDGNFPDKKTPSGRKVFWSRGNGWVFGGLGLVLEILPQDHPTRPFYENLLREMAGSVIAAQQADGLWTPSLLDPKQVPIGETSGSAFYVFGLAWGINHGLLNRATAWPAIERGWKGLLTRIKPDGYVGYVQRIGLKPESVSSESRQDYGTGAFLLAGSEIIRALGGARIPPDQKAFLAQAEALAELKEPRAYARLLPERKDDLAWENDKVAFRIYGPALRSSIEDSGIDVWCKRVTYPIIDKWYALDLAGKQSYHQDHGEGYDTYKVADSRGCGGLGIWSEGKLITSDVYINPRIMDTKPDVASFRVVYRYPDIEGRKIDEIRYVTLRKGERTFEVKSVFMEREPFIPEYGHGKPVRNLPIAVGLFTQTPGTEIVLDKEQGVMIAWDRIDGESLGTGVAISPASVIEMRRVPHGEKSEQALCILRSSEKGEVAYRAGYAWSKDGDITTLDAWKAYLKQRAK